MKVAKGFRSNYGAATVVKQQAVNHCPLFPLLLRGEVQGEGARKASVIGCPLPSLTRSVLEFTGRQMNQTEANRVSAEEGLETISIPADRINQPGADADLSEWLRGAIDRSTIRTLALDLGSVGQLGSIGLNRLIQFNRIARQRGLEVILTNVQPTVNEILTLTRLERLFSTGRRSEPIGSSHSDP